MEGIPSGGNHDNDSKGDGKITKDATAASTIIVEAAAVIYYTCIRYGRCTSVNAYNYIISDFAKLLKL